MLTLLMLLLLLLMLMRMMTADQARLGDVGVRDGQRCMLVGIDEATHAAQRASEEEHQRVLAMQHAQALAEAGRRSSDLVRAGPAGPDVRIM